MSLSRRRHVATQNLIEEFANTVKVERTREGVCVKVGANGDDEVGTMMRAIRLYTETVQELKRRHIKVEE